MWPLTIFNEFSRKIHKILYSTVNLNIFLYPRAPDPTYFFASDLRHHYRPDTPAHFGGVGGAFPLSILGYVQRGKLKIPAIGKLL